MARALGLLHVNQQSQEGQPRPAGRRQRQDNIHCLASDLDGLDRAFPG